MRPGPDPPDRQSQPGPPTRPRPHSRPRRRPDLTLPLPQRDASVPVPLPLPPPSAPAAPSSSIPQVPALADLERVRRVGSGSGGSVWMVRHRPTGRVYALKVIHGRHDHDVRWQMRHEIEILRAVDSPSVVRCHGSYEREGEVQILLEYMDGGSLEGRRIASEAQLADVARQVLAGLAYLHRRRIVHRDIKPSNLLINGVGAVKIADFGVGRILAQTMDECKSAVGTIAYMSPERIDTNPKEGAYEGRAGDIWAFGMSVLEFYLGMFPYGERLGRQGDWASLMMAICYGPPPLAPATASPDFRDFVASCLQKDPERRLTATQLLQHRFITRAAAAPPDLSSLRLG